MSFLLYLFLLEGYVFIFVQQDYTKTNEQISTKLWWRMNLNPD